MHGCHHLLITSLLATRNRNIVKFHIFRQKAFVCNKDLLFRRKRWCWSF